MLRRDFPGQDSVLLTGYLIVLTRFPFTGWPAGGSGGQGQPRAARYRAR
jgi:hypothetical protein